METLTNTNFNRLSYLAGILEAKAHVRSEYGLTIGIRSNYLPLLTAFSELFGGYVRPYNDYVAFQYTIVGEQAATMLKTLLPHMQCRKAEFQDALSNHVYSLN